MFERLARLARRALAGLAALALAGAAAPAAAEPALWVLKDEDSTIYLMGTVHVLRPDTRWRSPRIDKALAESRELVLEAAGLDDPAVMGPLIRAYGMNPPGPLSTLLPPKARPRLAAAAQAVGVPLAALEPMEPWLAGLTLSLAPVIKAGYDAASGVEMALSAEARAAGRPITGLETAERQIRYLDEMAPADQVSFVVSTLDQLEDSAALLDEMVAAWAAGDMPRLERAFLHDLRQDHPGLYRALIVERNRAWARALKDKLAGSGVSFVAVGAGHLVGPDSVQAELARLGIRAERQ